MSETLWTWTNILIFAVIVAAGLMVLYGVWMDRRAKRADLLRMQREAELPEAAPYRPASMVAMQEETAKRFIALLAESKKSDS